MREFVEYLDPVLHVAIINDLQDFLLLNGQFIGLRRLETRKQISLHENKRNKCCSNTSNTSLLSVLPNQVFLFWSLNPNLSMITASPFDIMQSNT